MKTTEKIIVVGLIAVALLYLPDPVEKAFVPDVKAKRVRM